MDSVPKNGVRVPLLAGKDPIAVARCRQGIVELIRTDAYVNLSSIAAMFPGKRVGNWTRSKDAKEVFQAFKEDPAYGGAEPIKTVIFRDEQTGQISEKGSWAHPDIAIHFAMWCSRPFGLWVARQIRHLLMYGEVNLHYTEWSEEDREKGHILNRDDIRELYR